MSLSRRGFVHLLGASAAGALLAPTVSARVLREGPDATVVVRTFSKVYGVAGLRVGYAVARPETAQALGKHVLSLGVNQLGAAAALASLGARGGVERERVLNREARDCTRRVFTDAGYACPASEAFRRVLTAA